MLEKEVREFMVFILTMAPATPPPQKKKRKRKEKKVPYCKIFW